METKLYLVFSPNSPFALFKLLNVAEQGRRSQGKINSVFERDVKHRNAR